jgi:hypothetical protein
MKHPGEFLEAVFKTRLIAIEWDRVETAQSIGNIGSKRFHRFVLYDPDFWLFDSSPSFGVR